MNAEFDMQQEWIEDLGGLSFDELRDLPFAVQASLDTSVYESPLGAGRANCARCNNVKTAPL